MVRKRKKETSPEALERVAKNNVTIVDGKFNYWDFRNELEKNLPASLRPLFKDSLADDITNERYRDYIEKANPLPSKQEINESDADYQKRKEKHISELNKARDSIKLEPIILTDSKEKKYEQKRMAEQPEPTYVQSKMYKQKSAKGKEYSRSFLNWTDLQRKFIQARIGRMNNVGLTNEYNNHFPVPRSVSSIKTMKLRMRKK